MKNKIIFVSHCFLNDAAKLKNQDLIMQQNEKKSKKAFLKTCLDKDIEIIQLPCPELIIYGSNRWGHVAKQFDNPYFRKTCVDLLETYIMQISEYVNNPDRFEIIGIVGIDGSPSCGVDFTCYGNWGGELGNNPQLNEIISNVTLVPGPGIFIEEFQKLLLKNLLNIKFFTLDNLPKL